jgi:hypothetical protein
VSRNPDRESESGRTDAMACDKANDMHISQKLEEQNRRIQMVGMTVQLKKMVGGMISMTA